MSTKISAKKWHLFHGYVFVIACHFAEELGFQILFLIRSRLWLFFLFAILALLSSSTDGRFLSLDAVEIRKSAEKHVFDFNQFKKVLNSTGLIFMLRNFDQKVQICTEIFSHFKIFSCYFYHCKHDFSWQIQNLAKFLVVLTK